MKDLNLTRSIPLTAVGALMLVGCGGRTLGLTERDGDGDPLSDESFDDTLREAFEDLCQKQIRCGYAEYNSVERCASYFEEVFDDQFNLDTRHCRDLAIDAIDCLAESRRCDTYAYACGDSIEDFVEDCYEYSYSYSYDYGDYYDY